MRKFWFNVGKAEIRHILAMIVVVCCFGLVFTLCYKSVPVENKDILNITIGFVFGGLLANVGGYFFGDKKNDAGEKKEKI